MLDERRAVEEPGPALGDLAAAAEGRGDVALTAAGGVEHRADAIGHTFRSGELLQGDAEVALVVIDQRRIRRVHQFLLSLTELLGEPVGESVESRWRVGDAALGSDGCCCCLVAKRRRAAIDEILAFDARAQRHDERQRARGHTHSESEHTSHSLPLSPSSGLSVTAPRHLWRGRGIRVVSRGCGGRWGRRNASPSRADVLCGSRRAACARSLDVC